MCGKLGACMELATMPPQLAMCHVYLNPGNWITFHQIVHLYSAVTAQKNRYQRVVSEEKYDRM